MTMLRTKHWQLWELSARSSPLRTKLRLFRSSKCKKLFRQLSFSPSHSDIYSEVHVDQECIADKNTKVSDVLQNSCIEDFVSYKEMILGRREQAQRSLIIEISHSDDASILKSFCSGFGPIAETFTYTTPLNQRMFLVEFEEKSCVSDLMAETMQYTANSGRMSAIIPFLRLNRRLKSRVGSTYEGMEAQLAAAQPSLSNEDLSNTLNQCADMSEQIVSFYKEKKLTDLGGRLRFLACQKVEWLLPRSLSHICALPFGSSVSTFGSSSSDVDILLTYWNPNCDSQTKSKKFPLSPLQGAKEVDAQFGAHNLDFISRIMGKYDPNFSSVIRILHARVPIIKCTEELTGLECDISFSNLSSHYMSELMYTLSCCDGRVSPLVFVVKHWAMARKINNKRTPGRGISNFSLTLLVLFYLMNTSPPVIPSLKRLFQMNGCAQNHELIEFFQSTRLALPRSKNEQSLEDLLYGFFKFYKEIILRKKLISLFSGISNKARCDRPLFLENPVDRSLNVTINVNSADLEYFQICCSLAMQLMGKYSQKNNADSNLLWGLNCFFADEDGSHSSRIPIADFFTNSASSTDKKKRSNIKKQR